MVWRACLVAVCLASIQAVVNAQSCLLRVNGTGEDGVAFVGEGTAFCIGMTTADKQLWMSAAHSFRGAKSACVIHEGVEYPFSMISRHTTEDVCIFETDLIDKEWGFPFSEAKLGERVNIPGYGSLIHGGAKEPMPGVIADEQWVDGINGQHVITGDSGAPVLNLNKEVVGVAVGHKFPQLYRTSRRTDYADQRLQTLFVPTSKCLQLVQHYYGGGQCGPGGCGPVWIDPVVVQPRRGITWPSGPPQVVPIARPAPQVYVPQQPTRPESGQVAGSSGLPSATVPFSAVKAAVDAYMRENADQLRGPAGTVGPAGPAGPPGKDGKDGKNGTDASAQPITVIFSRGRQEVDRETYPAGKPIVIDLETLK